MDIPTSGSTLHASRLLWPFTFACPLCWIMGELVYLVLCTSVVFPDTEFFPSSNQFLITMISSENVLFPVWGPHIFRVPPAPSMAGFLWLSSHSHCFYLGVATAIGGRVGDMERLVTPPIASTCFLTMSLWLSPSGALSSPPVHPIGLRSPTAFPILCSMCLWGCACVV